MKDVNKFSANPVQKRSSDKNIVDPKEFQKSLHKVEKSEESDQKKKKSKQQSLEEDVELEENHVAVNVPKGLFKQIMQNDPYSSTIFDTEESQGPNLVPEGSFDNDVSSSSFIPEYDENQTSNINVATPQNSNTFLDSQDYSSDEFSSPEEISSSNQSSSNQFNDSSNQGFSQESPQFNQDNNMGQNQQTSSNDSNKQSKKSEKSSSKVEKSKKKKKTKESKKDTKKTKKTKKRTKSTKSTKEEKEIIPDQKAEKPKDISDQDKEISFSAPKEEEEGKKQGAKLSKDNSKTSKIDGKDESNKISSEEINVDSNQPDTNKDDSSDDGSDSVVAPEAVQPMSVTNVAALQLSPFANIPKDVFELFQKMVGLMTIEKDNGKTTTTVTLNLPNSVFDKGELVLDHYDTAPHAYNVQFLGSPEAIEKFNASIKGLNNAITESKLTFSINVLSPKLSKNYAGRIEGSDEGDPQEEKGGKEKEK